ncbi:MAG: SCO family protein [Alphaproteobacteria bacterium]|nr:SCO family protein [Alphaproteobacteria bacterium]
MSVFRRGFGLIAFLAVPVLPALAAPVIEETLPVPSMSGHFTLQTPDGRTVSDANFRGKWLLVYFGYTNCPDVCPTVLNEIGVALNEMGPLARKIQPVFISVDPVRDKAPVLKKYLSSFDPRIVGLRGDGEATEAAAKSFHVYYRPVSLGNAQYTMDHSGFLYLIDPKGKFVTLITGNLPGHGIAQALRKQIK